MKLVSMTRNFLYFGANFCWNCRSPICIPLLYFWDFIEVDELSKPRVFWLIPNPGCLPAKTVMGRDGSKLGNRGCALCRSLDDAGSNTYCRSSPVTWFLQSLFWLNMSNAGNAKLKSVSRLIGRMKTLHVKGQQGEDAKIVPKYSKICFPTTLTLCWVFILTLTLKSSFQNPESRYATFFTSFGYKGVVR